MPALKKDELCQVEERTGSFSEHKVPSDNEALRQPGPDSSCLFLAQLLLCNENARLVAVILLQRLPSLSVIDGAHLLDGSRVCLQSCWAARLQRGVLCDD